jgi:UDP-glucose 4-epimerase
MLMAMERSSAGVNIFNLGTDSYCEVNDSIGWICEALGVTPKIEYSGGDRGWIGDNPFIYLDTKKICALGWKPTLTIRQGVIKTLDYIRSNPHAIDASR